jgi:V/A-type H+-transporting ATPase subunit C
MKSFTQEPQRMIRLSREGYPYTYARISARKGRLIPRADYQRLLKLELNGIIRHLQESQYREVIDSLVGKHVGVDLIERALNLDMVRTATQLRRITAPEVRLIVDAFLTRWDVENVKTVLRGIAAASPRDYILSLLVPAGTLNEAQLRKLAEQPDVPSALKRLKLAGSQAALKAYEKGGLTEPISSRASPWRSESATRARRSNGSSKMRLTS